MVTCPGGLCTWSIDFSKEMVGSGSVAMVVTGSRIPILCV